MLEVHGVISLEPGLEQVHGSSLHVGEVGAGVDSGGGGSLPRRLVLITEKREQITRRHKVTVAIEKLVDVTF